MSTQSSSNSTTDDDEFIRQSGLEMAVLRKLVFQMAGGPDPDETSLMEAALLAVDRVNDLEERISSLEGATGINLENAEYKQMSRAAKVKRIREKIIEQAKANGGKAAMDYNDVIWLFDGHPSGGHAFELLKTAAGYDEDTGQSSKTGFTFEKRAEKNDRLTVDLDKLPEKDP